MPELSVKGAIFCARPHYPNGRCGIGSESAGKQDWFACVLVAAHLGVKQDFTVLKGDSQEGPLRIDDMHRRCENADVYFACNSAKEMESLLCRFRDADGGPEVWCPVTGMICLANVFQRHDDGSCDIALDLPALGSAIVVFRRDGVAPERTAEPPATGSPEQNLAEGRRLFPRPLSSGGERPHCS